ncbi:tRNA pseudouridine(38-40) synthase TruA [Fibrobacter sp. UWB7]|jgi:tRNA pseudouridine38-40 synthase|uniref:tRNA pseudouridine(38-40) synthase TruA n=1 Tax=Fibrobacter sp. UWB7 TaxID=1896206 RepID=UPI00090F2192|nr:tRNA pseudouridine(38-40) synthase TruA [Fibrobacter sp. UWB7]SHM98689.1 tRNA pseudouridine38-40 synthase [Fibrobacter sp. UWB7]
MRYRFRCEYLGSAFYGWQEQNCGGKLRFVTVQSTLEEALSTALRAPIRVVGSGRTDTGVHARGQCVHFDFDGELDPLKVVRSVNGLTKRLIRIRDLEPCAPDFNARYDAVLRYYQYTIFTRPVALMRDFGWECGSLNLDIDAMGREAQSFLGEHDFIDFCIPRNDGKSTLCTLSEFRLERLNDWSCMFHIKGNRFLHRQVRAMVGTLFDIGRGRYPEGTVNQIFEKKFKGERTWAPPQGLVLENVEYRDY